MSFSDIINNIFGQDWLQATLRIIETGAAGVIVALWAKLKKRFVEGNDNIASFVKTINDLKGKVLDLKNNNDSLFKLNEQLQKQNEKLIEGMSSLGEMLSVSFYSSKAVPADAKVKITEAVTSLKQLGFNVKQALDTIEKIDETPEATVEEVEQIKEEQQAVAAESIEKAENTEAKSYDIYNKILNEQ